MEDLETAALRVVHLEKCADDAHKLAQQLNKDGRFAEAQAAYAEMHRLEDEASILTKQGFLRNIERGLLPPNTGAPDAQANCIARLAPLAAAFAGDAQLMTAVECATRVTQNSDAAVGWACAGAAVLEALLLRGRDGVQAVAGRDGRSVVTGAMESAVRGVMAELQQGVGSTDTSLWTHYKAGEREYCGNSFPDGMVKNQRLAANVITPTTKAESHDAPITPAEIVSEGLMSQADWDQVLPEAPHDLVCELSKRYVYLYERITGEQFIIPSATEPVNERIQRAITTALKL
ncbi:MAG: hypothetical protein WDW36_004710 [Sanguina aurantia]